VAGIAGYLLITNPGWNVDSVFTGFGDGRRLFLVRAHQSVAFLALVVALSFVLPSVWGPVLATIGSAASSLVHRIGAVRAWMRLRASPGEVRAGFRELPEMIRFGLKLTPGSLASGIGGQSTTWVLGAIASVATVGAYSRAGTIPRRFAEVNWRMREMLFPALVRRRAADDREAFVRALVDSLRYQSVGLLLPAAVIGGASVSVMGLFGPEFEFAAPALSIMMLFPVMTGTNGLRAAAVIAIDRPLNATFAQVAGLVVKLAVIVPLTMAWGITGAAIAGLTGPLTVNIWLAVVVRRHLGLGPTQLWPPRHTAGVVLAYAAGFGTAAALQNALVQPFGLAFALLAGAVAYVVTYVGTGAPTERDRARVRALLARLRARAEPRVARPAA
jgi:O-antigen/teichoic acid export membrane protein